MSPRDQLIDTAVEVWRKEAETFLHSVGEITGFRGHVNAEDVAAAREEFEDLADSALERYIRKGG